jgi:hypothetical protein
MLLYFLIPDGMKYKKIEERGISKDAFVDANESEDGPKIYLQPIARQCLQRRYHEKYRQVEAISLGGLTIYRKTPPKTSDLFLEYLTNGNGENPSQKVTVIEGMDWKSPKKVQVTKPGGRWFDDLFLFFSPEKRQAILEHDREQQQNKRKLGDSPYPN